MCGDGSVKGNNYARIASTPHGVYALPHDSWLGGHTPQPWLTPCQANMKKAEEEEKRAQSK